MIYAITRGCNCEAQHWRGLLRGYAVTRGLDMCVGACVRACMRVRVCACEWVYLRNRVTT